MTIKRTTWVLGLVGAAILGGAVTWHNHQRGILTRSKQVKRAHPVVRQRQIPTKRLMAGVIEGFYGPKWSFSATTRMFRFMHHQGLNTFVYAPKSAPYLRAQWNLLYPAARLKRLARLVNSARHNDIHFVCSISPGLSIQYSSLQDQKELLSKINQLWSVGVHRIMLSFDDIPSTLSGQDAVIYHNNLALAQSDLTDKIYTLQLQEGHAVQMLFTPTVYSGVQNNAYWQTLKTHLNSHIPVIWTGPQVLSKAITGKEVRAVQADIGHSLVIWDNYPVNDYTYVILHHPQLFMGPLLGRSPNMINSIRGYLFNPMLQPYASEISLSTGAQFLRNPKAYRPTLAWQDAFSRWKPPIKQAMQSFAGANSVSFLASVPLDQLSGNVGSFWSSYHHHGNLLRTPLYTQFVRWNHNAYVLQHTLSGPLYHELAPWIQIYQNEAKLAIQVIHLLETPKASDATQIHQIIAQQQKINASANQLGVHTILSQWFAKAIAKVPGQ